MLCPLFFPTPTATPRAASGTAVDTLPSSPGVVWARSAAQGGGVGGEGPAPEAPLCRQQLNRKSPA